MTVKQFTHLLPEGLWGVSETGEFFLAPLDYKGFACRVTEYTVSWKGKAVSPEQKHAYRTVMEMILVNEGVLVAGSDAPTQDSLANGEDTV